MMVGDDRTTGTCHRCPNDRSQLMSLDTSTSPGADGSPVVPRIARLAHVGVYVHDLDRAVEFYRDILGLQVTDTEPAMGLAFLSSRPEVEHHELLLAAGRDVPG